MLRFIFLGELVFAALFLYFVITQIIVPVLRGTPILPWLEDEAEIRGKLRNARQDVVEAELQVDLHRTKERKSKIKSSIKKGR